MRELVGLLFSFSKVREKIPIKNQVHYNMLTEHQRRLEAIATAERLLLRREQQVSIREEVLKEALRAGGKHLASSQWEEEVDRMVTEAAARLPPPIALSAFVNALEDRAIELEVMHLALERKDAQLEENRREVARVQARLNQKEEYLSNWMKTMEVSLQGMCEQEEALASQARRRQEGEAELLVWTQQLRSKEDLLQNKERVLSLKLKEATAREQRATQANIIPMTDSVVSTGGSSPLETIFRLQKDMSTHNAQWERQPGISKPNYDEDFQNENDDLTRPKPAVGLVDRRNNQQHADPSSGTHLYQSYDLSMSRGFL